MVPSALNTRFTVGHAFVRRGFYTFEQKGGIRRPCDAGYGPAVNHPFHWPTVRNSCYSRVQEYEATPWFQRGFSYSQGGFSVIPVPDCFSPF